MHNNWRSILNLKPTLSHYWQSIQVSLFPFLREELGPLTTKMQQLVSILEIIRIEEYIPRRFWDIGRPPKDSLAIARAYVAKAVFNMPTTRALIDRLHYDSVLRRICGFEKKQDSPSESVFSRRFEEFAASELPQRVHAALIKRTYEEQLVGHLSRDATAIEAREKPVQKEKDKTEEPQVKQKRGRPKKGEQREEKKQERRIEKQLKMRSVKEMLDDLPKACDVGTKRNSQGHQESWIGYKLHLDVADGEIPISCILTSASTHDSQVAIPLARISHDRVINLYDLMDSAYDVWEIHEDSRKLGHVPIIDVNPRRDKTLAQEITGEEKCRRILNRTTAEQVRYNERSTVERVNARIKDDFGGRMVRVRKHNKVMCHLMFGVLALTADQLLRFVT